MELGGECYLQEVERYCFLYVVFLILRTGLAVTAPEVAEN